MIKSATKTLRPTRPNRPGYYWINDRRDDKNNAHWELAYWSGTALTLFTPEHHLQPTWTVVYDPELEYWITRPLDEHYAECFPVAWIPINTPSENKLEPNQTQTNGHTD